MKKQSKNLFSITALAAVIVLSAVSPTGCPAVYTVIFESNGGSHISIQTVSLGGTVIRPTNPTRSGYTFDNWYSNASLTTVYNFAAPVTGNITLYAGWYQSGQPQPSVNVETVWISGGTFTMGSPASDPNRYSDEGPQRQAALSGFYMGKYEVTQEQYRAVMGSNPSEFRTAVSGESGTPGLLPVENVSWYDAIVFCNRLSMAEGLSPAYRISGSTDPAAWGSVPTSMNATWNAVEIVTGSNGYRLPTEAQWEYACRAGTTTAYNTGAAISDSTGWYVRNSGNMTHRVGLKPANAWGLHDMHGNVWEWCWDWYGTYPSVAQTDPAGASSGSVRVIRGGGWFSYAGYVRSAFRGIGSPNSPDSSMGFRLVRP